MKNLIAFSALLVAVLAAPTTLDTNGSDGDVFRQNMAIQHGAAFGPTSVLAPFSIVPPPIDFKSHLSWAKHGGLHNRAEEEESVMEDASARTYGSYAEAATGLASIAGLSAAAPAHAGSAMGLFPHARIGGCAIPLLLSCSPNIVAGHLVKSQAYPSYSTPSYRSTEQETNTVADMRESPNMEAKNAWSDAERSSSRGASALHTASINVPYHQHLSQDGRHILLGALPQSNIYHPHGGHVPQ
ncbi:hypothetical protein EVAR_94301_1 [Eumeta japonica]|uniref:Uncharacterized protein n=1 Tax=Eumeta variegata TaxID=151549 RepID=A0A4C1UGC4_EUMVA|nr:hypothetical protein EVAR_94301_1 [Eumeta japonica]